MATKKVELQDLPALLGLDKLHLKPHFNQVILVHGSHGEVDALTMHLEFSKDPKEHAYKEMKLTEGVVNGAMGAGFEMGVEALEAEDDTPAWEQGKKKPARKSGG